MARSDKMKLMARTALYWPARLVMLTSLVIALPAAGAATDADQAWLFSPAASASQPAAIKKQAEAGDMAAQLAYAKHLYAAGDKAEAVMWLTEANAQGSLRAQYLLGLLYARGDGVAQDMAQSRYFLEKAAKQHYPPAETALGLQLLDAEFDDTSGASRSPTDLAATVTRGAELLRDAAGPGYAPAQYRYGLVLWNGTGLPRNPQGALTAFQSAADQGNAEAAYMAGSIQVTGPKELRNLSAARQVLRHCIDIAPKNSDLLRDARKLLESLPIDPTQK